MKQITELEIIKYAELRLILEANILNSCCLCNSSLFIFIFRYFISKNLFAFAFLLVYFVAPSQTSKACSCFLVLFAWICNKKKRSKSLVLKANLFSRSVLYENKFAILQTYEINCLPYAKALETCVLILLTFYFIILFSLNVYLNPDWILGIYLIGRVRTSHHRSVECHIQFVASMANANY